jgi:hypothetical protein
MTDDARPRPAPGTPWLRFEEIRVSKVDSLEAGLDGCPRGAGELPLLAVQVTFDLSRLVSEERPTFRRAQYVSAWRVGGCDAEAVARLPARGLLLPYAMAWDGCPAVGFELCERLSPLRDATRLTKMRVRPLRTYLMLVVGEGFAPRGSRKCWQKVTPGVKSIRRAPQRAGAVT